MGNKVTTESFIKRARKVHGDLYDYSEVVYLNAKTPVRITDPVYGSFDQSPDRHLRSLGHPARARAERAVKRRKTTSEFIEQARQVHGDLYDYSKVKYEAAHKKITITDAEYGDFEQTPDSHLSGKGNPKRAVRTRSSAKRLSTAEFIDKARKIHGDLYDYSKTEYIDAKTKVIITDPKFGDFQITPTKHLSGGGCQRRSGRHRYSTEEWIAAAREVHGDLYDYSETHYKNAKTKVKIKDPDFGLFEQTPERHLAGSGHPERGNMNNSLRFRKSTNQFISEARKVHGKLYDYSKVEYINAHSKITVIDPDFGEFQITPARLLAGGHCPRRVGKHRYTTREWIEEAKRVHGDTYDYSAVDYRGAKSKVTIIDPVHGPFEQLPTNHLSGQGSPYRAGNIPLNTEEFIKRAREVHGDTYDYSLVEYTNSRTKVTIIDPEHGTFQQTPINHLSGSNSPWRAGNMAYDQESFVRRATEVHSGLYDYSKAIYKNYSSKVTIIDPEYGEFEQAAGMHLQGQGCPLRARNHTDDINSFIKKARRVHGDTYDYSRVDYQNSLTPVLIIDPVHGEFYKSPSNHLRGQGHPDRAPGGFDPTRPAILYYLRVANGTAYKIGVTNRTVEERYGADMQIIQILKTWNYELGRDAELEESRILGLYDPQRYTGPDLLANGNTELFRTDVLGLDNDKSQRKSSVTKIQVSSPKRRLVTNRYNTQTWILAAKKVHGDLYDYSKTEYKGSSEKVLIIDPVYGEFWQNPSKHLTGAGNPERAKAGSRQSQESFIMRAGEVHDGLYDYSKLEYKNANTKVLIIDPEYGEFWQSPSHHLRGQGHPTRRYKKIAEKQTYTKEKFVEVVRKVHGDLYNYDKVDYVNSRTKVTVTDPDYGDFEITPNDHQQGQGHPARKRR